MTVFFVLLIKLYASISYLYRVFSSSIISVPDVSSVGYSIESVP